MRKNTTKFKSNPGKNSQHNIRSSSIRDIIGDRRFNGHFSHVNTHGTEALKKVKRMKVGEAETDDHPDLERNDSSIQFEVTEDLRRCCGDFSAKTSEYAFFKKMKENTCSDVNVHLKYHDNQLDNLQQSDRFTREEIRDVQKVIFKYGRSSFPAEKGRDDDTHYSFLATPCCGLKNSEVNHGLGAGSTSAQKVRPGEYNWLSPSVGSKTKTSGDKGVFSAKREKLRHWVADKSLNEANELSSKGFDLVSVLISRILPKVQENNRRRDPMLGQIKNGSKCKLSYFSESEAAKPIKNQEAYKRKLAKSRHLSYLDDGFSRSTRELIDTDLLEWDLMGSESCSAGHARKSSFQYNRSRTEGGFRIPNFAIEGIVSFDEALSRYESSNFMEIEELEFDNGPKLLEQPRTLLLGWENDSFKDRFHLSALDSPTEINTFSDDDYQLCLPDRFISPKTRPSSPYYLLDGVFTPYIDRYREEKHFPAASAYTPKHLTLPVEDCSIDMPPQDYVWSPNYESIIEKEHNVGSEAFLFLIQSPADNLARFLNTGLRSFVVNDENDENFVYGPDRFMEGRVKDYHPFSCMESFHDKHFDHIGYPLLLHDSSNNEGDDFSCIR